ncbi:VIER F-box protein 2 [Tanacetum coccineum]
MSRMEDDLFTYEVEIAKATTIPCDLKKEYDSEQQMSHESDDDMEYDPSDVEFTEWLASKNFNYKTMDHYTMNALWIYWGRGDDEVELTDKESFDSDDEDEVAKIFRIETNVFDFETLTKNIKDDWIYEWNKDVPWVHERPWTENEVWKDQLQLNIIVSHLIIKFVVQSGLPVAGKMMDMDEMIDEDDESSNEGWKRWDNFDITNRDNEESENVMEHEEEERCKVFDDHERPICYIRRFEMIKYSLRDDEEYVAIKQNEYDDLMNTSKDAIYAYQEIFRMMDEGWMKGKQCPIHYVSLTLNEAKRNYASMEKLARLLLHMTRRLRRYFEAHLVKVITEHPIKQILSKIEASGKLEKYVVELGAYNITFEPWNDMKGQVLADFISETPNEEPTGSYFRTP